MTHCISCGTQLPSEAVHCPKCGAVTPYKVSASGVSPDDLTAAPSSSVSTENKPFHDSDIPPEIVLLQGPYELINPYASPPPPPTRRRVKPALLISILVATLILASGGIVTGFMLGTKNTPRGSGSTPPLKTASVSGSTVTGTATAVIAVVAQKSQLTVYINGKMVNQASDDHFAGGAIGLFAFNLTNHNSTDEVAFNNVKVWTI